MIDFKRIFNNKGFILPVAMMLGTIGMIFTLVPFTNLINREIRLDHSIAKTKSRYNAESGLASVYAYFSLDSLSFYFYNKMMNNLQWYAYLSGIVAFFLGCFFYYQ